MPFGSLGDLGFVVRQPQCATRPPSIIHQKRTHPWLYRPGAKCGPPVTRVITPEGEEAPPPHLNRLLGLPTRLIQDRRNLLFIGPLRKTKTRWGMRVPPVHQRPLLAQVCTWAWQSGLITRQECQKILNNWPDKTKVTVDQAMKVIEATKGWRHPVGTHPYDYIGKYGKEAVRTLLEVWWNPSEAELEDLQLIDYGLPSYIGAGAPAYLFPYITPPTDKYGRTSRRGFVTRDNPLGAVTPDKLTICQQTPKTSEFTDPRGRITQWGRAMLTAWRPSPAAAQPFFCPPPPKVENKTARPFPFPKVLNAGNWRPQTRPEFWGIDLEDKWEKVKPLLMRALVAERALLDYPWPSPKITFSYVWGEVQKADFKKYVIKGPPKTWNDVRAFLALSILKHYNEIIGVISRRQKKRAKKKKRRAIVRAVASLAVGAVFAVAAPAIFGVTVSAIKTVADVRKRKKAAEGMMEMAKQFQRTDTAFAAELERVAKQVEEDAAAAEAAAPMSPEQADAEAEAVAEEVVERKGVTIIIEGEEAGHAETAEAASSVAQQTAKPGDRVEFLVAGKSTGLWLRTKDKFEKVPKEAEAKIRAMPPDQLREIVMTAETKVPVVNYIAVGVPLAAAVFL